MSMLDYPVLTNLLTFAVMVGVLVVLLRLVRNVNHKPNSSPFRGEVRSFNTRVRVSAMRAEELLQLLQEENISSKLREEAIKQLARHGITYDVRDTVSS